MKNSPVVLITGAAKRVGAALAEALHEAGYCVIIHCRSITPEIAAQIEFLNMKRPASAQLLCADLCDHHAVLQLAEKAEKLFGRIDALINNASSFYATPVDTVDESDWDSLFASNTKAPYFLSVTLAPALVKHNGCIINIADIYATFPLKNFSIYSMAKAANQMMTKSLAIELAPNVRVNGIAPGAILWPETAESDGAAQNKLLEKIPLERRGDPTDMVKAVKFLLEDSPYMNGHILTLDGGRTLRV